MKLIFLFLIFVTHSVSAQIYRRLMSREEIFNFKINASLIVKVLNNKQEVVSLGSGFIYGKRGYLVTAHHVVEPWLKNKNYKILIRKYGDRKSLSKLSLVKCSDERGIDLCVFKSRLLKSFEYFKVKKGVRISKGHFGRYIGHCKGDFSSGEGLFVKEYKNVYEYISAVKILGKYNPTRNRDVKIIEMKEINYCEGDSGGPLFGPSGELWGVTSEVITLKGSAKKMHLFISSKEVESYLSSGLSSTPLDKERIYIEENIPLIEYYKVKFN